MIRTKFINHNLRKLLFVIVGVISFTHLYAQSTPYTLKGRNIYNPELLKPKDTTLRPDSLDVQSQFSRDSIEAREKFIQDSIETRLLFIRDSIEARLKFIRDSVEARQKFIRDSIIRRQRIIDSLTFLKTELPALIDASLRTVKEQIIVYNDKIRIIGDSTLSNYTCRILPFNLALPYVPWKATLNLSDKPIKFDVDTIKHKIVSMKTPFINCSFIYGKHDNILIIKGKGTILNKRSTKFYKAPIDSVFYDRRGMVVKIKRYIQFYSVTNNYQRGTPLFLHLSQVKQFEYNANKVLTKQRVVSFCDRWSAQDEKKVCNILTYSLALQGKTYILTRRNDPVNDYSDGSFAFEFDAGDNLKSVSFKNVKNSEDWKCFIEVNEAGNVSRYVHQNKGIVRQTLLVNYYLDDPRAKHKVETVTCTFEDDGISYYQKNNTTGKTRIRNKMTGAWGPWQ